MLLNYFVTVDNAVDQNHSFIAALYNFCASHHRRLQSNQKGMIKWIRG